MYVNLVNGDTSRVRALNTPSALEGRGELPVIFGLRYLEEEAGEIHDVVGCLIRQETEEPRATATGCDDHD